MKKSDSYILAPERECLSRAELENLQSERLVETVKKVYENVKVYRRKMDDLKLKPEDIRGVKDLYKLPFTTKQDLRDNYPYGMLCADFADIVRLHASSGTTGQLTVVGYTKNDIEIWGECVARAFASAGVTKSDVIHVAYGYGLFTGGLGFHYGAEKLGAAVVPASSGNTRRQLTLLRDFGASCLACTPSYAAYLASEAEKYGISLKDLRLKAGLFGAEPWSDNLRKQIENALNIDALDIYGMSEVSGPGVAVECSEKHGLHIQEDHFIPEIIDPAGAEPLPEGDAGELVFTTITKTGQPLIRYRTRDLTNLNYGKCPCGRTTVRMSRILGRSDDMLVIRGVNVFPSQIETAVSNVVKTVPNYMIYIDRVNNLDAMEIRIEIDEGMGGDTLGQMETLRDRIAAEIRSVLGITAGIKLVEKNTLPRSEGGKAKRVVDKRKI